MIDPKELRPPMWEEIKGWEGYYKISRQGEIFSIRRGRMMKVWIPRNKKQYPRVTLSKSTFEKSYTVHRLVAVQFIPNPLAKISVNHIDGNKHNNKVENLEWATISENMIHAVKLGLVTPPTASGEAHPLAKLNLVDIEMIKILAQHDFTKTQIAKRFNVHETNIGEIIRGTSWKQALTGTELTVNLQKIML